jgi:uncharacterized protein (TIGR01777 family)
MPDDDVSPSTGPSPVDGSGSGGPGRGRIAVVAGSSGLIGSALVDALLESGWRVRRLVRPGSRPSRGEGRGQGVSDVVWDPATASLDPDALAGASLVVNLAGAGIGDKRWTDARKATITLSRTSATSLLAGALAQSLGTGAVDEGVRFLQGSAVGWYGDRGDEVLTESSPAGSGFLAEVCEAWESAARPAADAGASVAYLRTGIVLSSRGGALGRVLPLARLGLSGPLGGGAQWWPWITLADHVRAQLFLADSSLTGPVNLAAPGEARQKDVLRAISRELRRPFGLPVPGFALRVALGEFAEDVLASQRMHPAALEGAGFGFSHTTPEAAAHALMHDGV